MESQVENKLPNVESAPLPGEQILNPGLDNLNTSPETEVNNLDKEALFSDDSMFGELSSPPAQAIAAPLTDDNDDISIPISTPVSAADNDLIEKEWVDNLKKMIVDTKGDPFARQYQFKEMQVDYLKKRYGRIINEGK